MRHAQQWNINKLRIYLILLHSSDSNDSSERFCLLVGDMATTHIGSPFTVIIMERGITDTKSYFLYSK